jgi:broad specificity phosphatase PhoE
MDKLIYIVRHGETDYNRKGIVQGQGVDTSLNELGRQQAAAFFEQYQDRHFELVITSTLKRTKETMLPFIEKGLPWKQYQEINEIDWGRHEGKQSSPELRADYKRLIDEWNRGNYHAGIEGGETAFQMGQRLQRFIDQVQQMPEQKILVCSHGRAIRALLCLMQAEPLKFMNNYQHANTGLYQVEQQGQRFRFLLENDLSHLHRLQTK